MASHDADQPVTQEQHKMMHRLWHKAGSPDREQRLALTAAAIGREITTSAELTRGEAGHLIKYMRGLDQDGVLAQRAAEFLAHRPAPTVDPAPRQHQALGQAAAPSYLQRGA